MVDQIDVTPNPRILQMLGEIAFEPWQCIAELVDNSLDAYLGIIDDQPEWLADMGLAQYSIHVGLPSQHEYDIGMASLTVQDCGPGMTLEELRKAVQAGFSGNDPLGKLGLFGMGFNIATARLGRVTQVRTTRADDTSWLVLHLDLDEMQRTGEFHAEVQYEEKEEHGYHGTVVEVLRLKPEFRGNLTSGPGRAAIKKQLSRIYSAILVENPVTLRLSEFEIQPWQHCIWDKSRKAVLGSGKEVPAYLGVDYSLPDNYFCNVCWHWSEPHSVLEENTCPACDTAGSIELKPRRIHGWLGIQRYFDQNHFGIDFIRNGRIIEQLNKDCFNWIEDGEIELEYPIDTTHWGGRIVGQINIDFAQVDYQKTSFSKNRNEWNDIIDYIRGSSPLRPKIAEERDYPENTSPLARLYSTFRSGRLPGIRMLVPGGSSNLLKGDNADASAWAEKFYQGDPDFISDSKWWEQVLNAEKARRGDSPDDNDDDVDPTDPEDPFGDSNDDDDGENDTDEEDPTKHLVLDTVLSQRYDFPDQHSPLSPIEITVYKDTRNLKQRELKHAPPLIIDTSRAPSRYTIHYHPHHPAFTEFAESPSDYLLIEIAHWFSTRHGGGEWTAGMVYQNLKNEYQRSKKLDLRSLGQTAADLLGELKEHLAECEVVMNSEDISASLFRELTQDVMTTSGQVEDVEELLKNGLWIERVSDIHILPVIQSRPDLVMDGKFFSTSFESVKIEDIQQETVDRIIGCLKDAIMIKKTADRASVPDKSLLLRADAALNYLIGQRA